MSIRRLQGQGSAEAQALATALAELGVPGRVETRAGLAVLIADAEAARRFTDPEVRRKALALAKEQGFTHLAVEVE